MENWIILIVVALVLGSAIFYIRKKKKQGARCIGCPDAVACSGSCAGCTGQCSGCETHKLRK